MDNNITLLIITSIVGFIFIIIMLSQRSVIKNLARKIEEKDSLIQETMGELNDKLEVKNQEVNRLTEEMGERAFKMFDEFKVKELGKMREEITKIAFGEANISFEQWKAKEEKEIRKDAIKRSREVTFGKITEHFLPFHPAFDFNPKDVRFIGSPIDMIIFEGMSDKLEEVNIHILEIKTGKSKLNSRQKVIKKAVLEKRVFWKEINLSDLESEPYITSNEVVAENVEYFESNNKSTSNGNNYHFLITSENNDFYEENYSYGYSFQEILDGLSKTFSLKFIDNQSLKIILDKYVHFSRTDLYYFRTKSSADHFLEKEEIKDYTDICYNDDCIDFLNENFHILMEDVE